MNEIKSENERRKEEIAIKIRENKEKKKLEKQKV